MVCVPCIVIPFLLWVFHRYIRPVLNKFAPWLPWLKSSDVSAPTKCPVTGSTQDPGTEKEMSNGVNGHVQTAEVGGDDRGKKDN